VGDHRGNGGKDFSKVRIETHAEVTKLHRIRPRDLVAKLHRELNRQTEAFVRDEALHVSGGARAAIDKGRHSQPMPGSREPCIDITQSQIGDWNPKRHGRAQRLGPKAGVLPVGDNALPRTNRSTRRPTFLSRSGVNVTVGTEKK
jgi:hypothetical protein